MKEITEDKGRVRPVVEGDFQCDENGNSTRFYEILSLVGYIKDDGTKIGYISKTDVPIGIPITDTEYWYPFQIIAVPKGDKGDKGDDGKSAYELYIEHGGTIAPVEAWLASLQGKDGKDGQPLMLRVTPDGQSLEISDDGGKTWYMYIKNFNRLRVLGYIDSISKLPKNANVGDIYGVLKEPVEEETSAEYLLYINTVKDWLKDYTITKVYDYDTELPSSATDGTTVLVPVDYLTLDKQKIDGYKVYRFDLAKNGWTLILDTAEIYAAKADIINYGDNVFALVQGEEEHTYDLYRRDVGWVYFGTNASITYVLVQDVEEGTEINILSGKAVKDKCEELNAALEAFKEEVKETYGEYIESPEFVRVVVDSENKILYGVKADGDFFYGVGCPSQVRSYVDAEIAKLKTKVEADVDEINNSLNTLKTGTESEAIDGTNKVFAFLADFSTSDTLKKLLDTKVDKVEGKTLIDEQYVQKIDNPEFVKIVTDSENKVLEGIKSDGTKVVGGDAQVCGNINIKGAATIDGNIDINGAEIKIIDNPEYVAVLTDAQDKILECTTKDGTKVIDGNLKVHGKIDNEGIQHQIDEAIDEIREEVNETIEEKLGDIDGDALKSLSSIDNPEYIQVTTDAQGRVIEAIRKDGKKVFPGGIKGISEEIGEINDALKVVEEKDNELEDRINTLETTVGGSYDITFKKGYIEWSDGHVTSSDKRLYTDHIKFNKDIHIGFTRPYIDKPNSVYLVYRVYLYENGVYKGLLPMPNDAYEEDPGQYTRYETVIPANTEFALVLRYSREDLSSDKYLYTLDQLIANNGFMKISEKSLYYQVPEYYLTPNSQVGTSQVNIYLDAKIKQIDELMRTTMGNGDAFIFITDIHFDRNQQHSPALIKYISDRLNIPRMFCGGDDFDGTSINVYEIYRKAFNGKYYFTIGNHEVQSNTERPYDYSYSSVCSTHWMNNDDVVWGSRELGYYYVNNNNDKIRYIFLNSIGKPHYVNGSWDGDSPTGYDANQLSWFENTALNVEQGWTIIIFTHIVLWRANQQEVVPVDYIIYPLAQNMINIVENYSGNGTIAGIFCGDDHFDRMYKTPIKDIPVIMTTTDGYPIGYELKNRPACSIYEQAFDVVVLDKTNKKFTMVRIGGLAYNGVGLNTIGDRVEYREITY